MTHPVWLDFNYHIREDVLHMTIGKCPVAFVRSTDTTLSKTLLLFLWIMRGLYSQHDLPAVYNYRVFHPLSQTMQSSYESEEIRFRTRYICGSVINRSERVKFTHYYI